MKPLKSRPRCAVDGCLKLTVIASSNPVGGHKCQKHWDDYLEKARQDGNLFSL